MIIKYLTDQLLAIRFKSVFAFVLIMVLAVSMIQLGYALHTLLSSLENGLIFEFAIFGGIALVSLVMLYLMFHTRKKAQVTLQGADLQVFALQFVEGFIEGIKKDRAT